MTIHIRPAGLSDASAIVQLITELSETAGDHYPLTEGFVSTYLSFPGSAVLLAEQGGQIVGLLSYSLRPNLYHAGNTCLIEEMVVHGPAQSQGVGGALLTELLNQLAASTCAEVSVTTMPDNLGAIRFYKKHGLVDEAVYLEKHFKPAHANIQTH